MQINKWAAPGSSIASQVRSLRKGNNDQVAIAIDMDPITSGRIEDEDDDKGKLGCNFLFFLIFFSVIVLQGKYILIFPSFCSFFHYLSARFQVTYNIKNSPKIHKTCYRHGWWPLVGTIFSLFFFSHENYLNFSDIKDMMCFQNVPGFHVIGL